MKNFMRNDQNNIMLVSYIDKKNLGKTCYRSECNARYCESN